MELWKYILGFGAVLVLLAFVVHDPVPEECQPNMMVYTTLAIMKGISYLCKLLSCFGWDEAVTYRRLISDFVHLSPIVPDSEVNVTNMMMGGVAVRLYQPLTTSGQKRGIVYFHGGGWTFGDLDMYEDMLVRISKRLDAVIASVDYSLGPEKPFPQAVYDSEAATRHFFQLSGDLQVDTHRIALMGDSAGGTLATVISRRLRDSGFDVMPKLQVLIYPVTQALALNTLSYNGNKDGPFLTKSSMVMYLSVYLFGKDYKKYHYDMVNNQHVLQDDPLLLPLKKFIDVNILPDDNLKDTFVSQKSDGKREVWNSMKKVLLDPDFAPLLADNLSGLPHAYVSTCQYDVLRDDGFFYVQRLREANVKVKHDHSMKCYHGWIWHRNYVPMFDELYSSILNYVDENL